MDACSCMLVLLMRRHGIGEEFGHQIGNLDASQACCVASSHIDSDEMRPAPIGPLPRDRDSSRGGRAAERGCEDVMGTA